MFGAEYEKNIDFLSENFKFLMVKFSIYLNRRVFVMQNPENELMQFSKSMFRLIHVGTVGASRKHTYIILTPLNPLLYSKTGVYRGIHYFSYFCSKHRLWVLVRTASPRRF